MTNNTKEEMGGGIALAILVVSLILLTLFLWSPVSYYLSKWNSFWDDSIKSTPSLYSKNWALAQEDCGKRAMKQLGVVDKDQVYLYIKSSDQFATYTCFGIKLEKIK